MIKGGEAANTQVLVFVGGGRRSRRIDRAGPYNLKPCIATDENGEVVKGQITLIKYLDLILWVIRNHRRILCYQIFILGRLPQ